MYEDIHEQIMDMIMELEGAEAAAEMKRLNADPVAAVPDDLHQQCLDMINATFLPSHHLPVRKSIPGDSRLLSL